MAEQTPITPGAQTSEFKLANRASWISIALMALGVLVDVADALVQSLTPIAAQFPDVKWIGGILLGAGVVLKVATVIGYNRARVAVKTAAITAGKTALVLLALFLAIPAFAQDVDPTAGTVDGAGMADAVAQSAPDPRWSFRLGGVTVSPAVSFSPTVLSLKDWSLSVGPNVGAGFDFVWKSGYGAATHATLRETSDGMRPLASLYAIVPWLQVYKLRPGVSYQIGGGAASWRDAFILGIAISDNFGFQAQ